MKKVLVTGANGFIGRAMIKKLSELGTETIAVTKEPDDTILYPYVRNIVCDMNNAAELPELISDRDIECAFFFAWNGSSGPARADYAQQLDNVQYTCDAIKAASELNIPKVVFASSIMEYEIQECVHNGVIPSINNMYSAGKFAARLMGEILAKNLNISYYPIIISNVFGEGENSPRLINTTIKKILSNEIPDFTEGTQMYDFIYISDAVNALLAVAEKGVAFKNYYLGSLNPRPLREFLTELGACFTPCAQMNFGKIPFNGVSIDYKNTFDIEAVKNDTGFLPAFTFTEGIEKTIDWMRKELNV